MKLHYRKYGKGKPIIILHGLYGSSDNWMSIAKELAENYEVWTLDQRNHGRSPHSNTHSYEDMKNDLLEFIQDNNIENPVLIGHSMGGKTVIKFAINYPGLISHLVVLDIAPKSYTNSDNFNHQEQDHKTILETMLSIHPENYNNRKTIGLELKKKIKSERISQFLLKNLKRDNNKSFKWTLNIKVLYENLDEIFDGFSQININGNIAQSGFSVLFIKGENSNYIDEDDVYIIEDFFPYAQFKTIKNAGHWLHAEQPQELLQQLKEFIS